MDFVTFDIAKKLKEKGFKLACIGHYEGDRFEYNTYDGYDINISYIARSYNDDDRFVEYTDVPVICQVLKWLREEKKIFIEIALSPDGYQHIIYTGLYCMATSCAYHFTFDGFYRIEDNYITYEQAAIAGIEYVVNNLI